MIAPNSQWNQPISTARYMGSPWIFTPSEPLGNAWDDSIMLTSIISRSGTNTLSSLTLLEPEPCMPMNLPWPQSGRMVICSRGSTKNTCFRLPSGWAPGPRR